MASETPVDQVVASQTSVTATQDALATATTAGPNTCKSARALLAKRKDIEVVRHWTFAPILDAPAILNHAIGVASDLEWHPENEKTPTPELNGKPTQIGYTVFRMSALRDCRGPADFADLLKKASVVYIRIIENCHLRSSHPKFKDTETNSLFCPTRFVSQADAKTVLEDVLNNQKLEDGSKAPVILIGHGWNYDEHVIKKQLKLSTPKLENVVFTVKSLARLAEQAGIIPTPDKALGEFYPNFDNMVEAGFEINLAGTWRHNGANDAVYQMTLAFLVVLFPLLYPNTASGNYPSDPTIANQTINEIWQDLARNKDNMRPLTIGYARFCFYCEKADDHDAEDCPTKAILVCSYCANAIGSQNKRYRAAVSTLECPLRQAVQPPRPPVPRVAREAGLVAGQAVKDLELIGSVFYSTILGGGPMGNYEVAELEANEKARLAVEELNYSDAIDSEAGYEVNEMDN